MKGGTLPDDFRWEQLEVVGDPKRVIVQISTRKTLGCSDVMCEFGSSRPMLINAMKKVIKLFAEEAMPASQG